MSSKNLSWLIVAMLIAGSAAVYAATTDFTANGTIVVPSVPGIGITADLLILGGSAESWSYNPGASRRFTVTNPDSNRSFIVGSADTAVRSLQVYNSSNVQVLCIPNSIPGSSFATIPAASGTYSVVPAVTYCRSRVRDLRLIPKVPLLVPYLGAELISP